MQLVWRKLTFLCKKHLILNLFPCMKIFIHSDNCSLHQTSSCQCICHYVTNYLLTRHVVNVYSTIFSVSSMHLSLVGLHRLFKCRKISKYYDLNYLLGVPLPVKHYYVNMHNNDFSKFLHFLGCKGTAVFSAFYTQLWSAYYMQVHIIHETLR